MRTHFRQALPCRSQSLPYTRNLQKVAWRVGENNTIDMISSIFRQARPDLFSK